MKYGMKLAYKENIKERILDHIHTVGIKIIILDLHQCSLKQFPSIT
jgi:hypothetical protein